MLILARDPARQPRASGVWPHAQVRRAGRASAPGAGVRAPDDAAIVRLPADEYEVLALGDSSNGADRRFGSPVPSGASAGRMEKAKGVGKRALHPYGG